jgi:hypothetical protein
VWTKRHPVKGWRFFLSEFRGDLKKKISVGIIPVWAVSYQKPKTEYLLPAGRHVFSGLFPKIAVPIRIMVAPS